MTLARIFTVLLGMSAAGGGLVLLVLTLEPVTRRLFSAQWHRNLYCAVTIFFAVPFGAALFPLLGLLTPQIPPSGWELEPLPLPDPGYFFSEGTASNTISLSNNWNILLFYIGAFWALTASVLLLHRIFVRLRFQRIISKSSLPVSNLETLRFVDKLLLDMNISRTVRLLSGPSASSPILTGLLFPTVLLPNNGWTQEELALALRHELTHLRQRDLWLKEAVSLVCILHWFNPLAWILCARLERWMELACDAVVVSALDLEQRGLYGSTILKALAQPQPSYRGAGVAFGPHKKQMKVRLTAMIHTKKHSKKAHVGGILALSLICTAGLLMGATSYTPPPETAPEALSLPKNEDTAFTAARTVPVWEEADQDLPKVESSAETPKPTASAPDAFLWPTDGGKVSAGFESYPNHSGTDIAIPLGTDVFATAGGVVTLAKEPYTGYGKYLLIDHGGGYQSLYAHCDSLLVEVGDEICAGQVIAKSGRSGSTTGALLHFELRLDGNLLDPEDYVSAS